MEAKILTFATRVEPDTTFDNDRFVKVRIYVQHDGKNYNGSVFSLESINKAKETLSNIPILAHVFQNEKGEMVIGSHDFSIEEDKVNDGEFRIVYDEIPVGVIPETNNYEIVNENGRNYVVVDGYIWKDYSNYFLDVVANSEQFSVSMEIMVDEYSFDGMDYVSIDTYKYTGVTVLGNGVLPGMKNARMEFGANEVPAIVSKYALELAEILNSKPEIFEEEEIKDDSEEEIQEEDMACGDKEKYEMTMNEKRQKLQSSIPDEHEEVEDGEVGSHTSYWLMDFSDSFVYVNVYAWGRGESSEKIVRGTYDAESLTVDKSSFVEVFVSYLTKEEIDLIDSQRSQMEMNVVGLNEKIATLSNENQVLREFKAQVDSFTHLQEVESVLSEFEHELGANEEFVALKMNAESMEVDSVRKECYAIVGRSQHKAPVQQKKQKVFSFVSVDEDSKNGRYGSLEKYFKKN